MRPRRERIYNENGFAREIDLSSDTPLEELRAEGIGVVRAMAARKIEAIVPALADPGRLLVLLLRYVRLLRRALDESRLASADAAALIQLDGLLARIQAVCKAADDIEAQLAREQDARSIFDHVEGLPANPLWPE